MNPPTALGHLSRLLLSRLDQRARLEVDELVMDSTYEYSCSCVCFVSTHRTPQCTVYLKSTIIVLKDFMLPLQKFTYTVKIYDPERRSRFTQRDLYSICHRFHSVKALRSALYHELEYEIPDGYYNVGYFEGSHHKKKWLVSSADLEAMYAHFKGKKQIPL